MLQSLERSSCVTDIMAACLLKITSLKAWLVMSWSVRADFNSILLKISLVNIPSIFYTSFLSQSSVLHALAKGQKNAPDTM